MAVPATALKAVTEGGDETARRIVAFLRGFSIEATRLNDGDLAALKTALPARSAVYLTAVPKLLLSETIAMAAQLRALDFEPVPHLAVRNIPSADALDDSLARLSAEGGVRRLLVIGGDRDRPAGPYNSAIEVIESGLLQRHGIVEVGMAGYPGGYPRLSIETLDCALTAKIEAAEQTGLGVQIVTQFSFDPAAIVSWLIRLRALAIEQPVRIGMAGPTDLMTLLRYARRCGVRASAQGLMRRAGLVKHMLGVSAPDGIVRPLAETYADGRLGRVAAHFFSFGGAAATARWAAAAAAGGIVLDRADGFGVERP